MRIIFSVVRDNHAAGFFERVRKHPKISFERIKIKQCEFLCVQLNVPCNASEIQGKFLEQKALHLLLNGGCRKIIVGKGADRELIASAGICIQTDRKAVLALASKIIGKVLKSENFSLDNLNCIFYSNQLNDYIIESIKTSASVSRYISLECGEYSKLLQESLMNEFGVAKGDVYGKANQKLLICFSKIHRANLWKISPDAVLNLSGETMDTEGVMNISGFGFSVPDKYRTLLAKADNPSEIVSELIECGAVTARDIDVT